MKKIIPLSAFLLPRNAHIDIPDLLPHVIVRGIEKRPVLLDDQDREVHKGSIKNVRSTPMTLSQV